MVNLMKASRASEQEKKFIPDEYKQGLSTYVGKKIKVICVPHLRGSSSYDGILDYVSNYEFGLRVSVGSSSYLKSFKYCDIFAEKIKIEII